MAAQVGDDRLVHAVTADADRAGVDDVTKREHRDFGGAAADVDDHVARGVGDGHARADGGGDGFSNETRTAGTRRQNRLANGALFHWGGAMGHADDDLGFGKCGAFVDFADEVLDHLLSTVEIRDHPVAHRPDRLDGAGGAAEHQLGIFAHCQHLLFAVLDVVGHHGGFVQHDPLAAHVHKRVRRAEVDGHVGREEAVEK